MAQLERSYSILLAWFRLDLNQRSSGYEPDGDSELPYGTPSAYLLVQRTSVILALSCDQLPPTELPTVVSRCSSRTRTDTGPILSRLPLPLGYGTLWSVRVPPPGPLGLQPSALTTTELTLHYVLHVSIARDIVLCTRSPQATTVPAQSPHVFTPTDIRVVRHLTG